MAGGKIHLKGQFTITRDRSKPLSLQIARQLQDAIETGDLVRGTRLPSSRSLARALSVSRNTVLTAYEELTARGVVRARRGAGVYVFGPATVAGFDLRAIMRDAQYPQRQIAFEDEDGNPLSVGY